MNNLIITGNLVNDIATNEKDGKLYAYDKIGAYNGKDKEGNQRDSMFFDFVVFGRDAELLRDMAKKGDSVTLIGRLEEDKTEKDGRIYINKRVICNNVTLNVRKPKEESRNQSVDPFQ
jgi:single-stranded DNA-binding protein